MDFVHKTTKLYDIFRASCVVGLTALSFYVLRALRGLSSRHKIQDQDKYDVIIVGGGTAGCVLAARLSEDPAIQVLVLEAGTSAIGFQFAEIPLALSKFLGGAADWGIYTEPQAHAGNRKCMWPRAKLLGGCSNINAMITHYGAPSDYDEWAELQKDQEGASGWMYQNLQSYFRKFERYSRSFDHPDVDQTLHGLDGPYDFGHFGHCSKLTTLFVQACEAAGIPRSPDLNTYKGTLGVSEVLTYIRANGKRSTTERAYLTPDVLARPNLTVATSATVTRILFDQSDSQLRAEGVEVRLSEGTRLTCKASKEVIICAGAVHTPHILMLSGIGPASHLSAVGVPVIADLPGVGSHLKDHLSVDLAYMDKTKQALSFMIPSGLTQRSQALQATAKYLLTGKGPLSSNLAESIGFVRSDDSKLFPLDKFPAANAPEDTTTGPDAPDIELFFSPLAFTEHTTLPPPNLGQYNFMLHAVLLRPKSSGTVRLRSADPDDPPVIDPGYLADPNDMKTLFRAVRLADKVAHTEPLLSVLDAAGDKHPELHHELSNATDEELEQLIRQRVQTLYHPTCSARMAPLENGGVVDPCLRVHGIPNLRIVDASIFPNIVSGHTAGPVLAVAEKAADLIKATVAEQIVSDQIKVRATLRS